MSITRPIRLTTTRSTSIRLKPIAWCWPIQRSICTPHGTAILGDSIDSDNVADGIKGKSADNNDETGKKVNIADDAGEHVQIDSYLSYPVGGSNPWVAAGEMCKIMGEKLPKAFEGSNADAMGLYVTPASQYNKLRQMMGEKR